MFAYTKAFKTILLFAISFKVIRKGNFSMYQLLNGIEAKQAETKQNTLTHAHSVCPKGSDKNFSLM